MMKKHLSAPSQLVLRQQQQFDSTAILAVNPPDAEWRTELPVAGSWHFHAGWAKAWRSAPGTMHQFGATAPKGSFDSALVWLPKEKKLTDYILAALAALLPAQATLWLVGDNRIGIKSIHKQIGAPFGPVVKLANGHHSTLLATQLHTPTAHFTPSDYRVETELPQPPLSPLKLASYPGVFAYPAIDAGSQMLLEHLPTFKAGTVLDFACGHGVLGAWLQRQAPELDISYLDVSAMALMACQDTLRLNGLTGTLIAADALVADLPKYDVIVSHPPFHTGQATDYSIGQQFLRDAKQHLQRNGEIWLVANRFLPWPELIEASFGHCRRVAQDNKFAVYQAQQRGRR